MADMASEDKKSVNMGCERERERELERPELMHILDLNDDCLKIICKKLVLLDQVRFSLACERFRSIFKNISTMEHKLVMLSKLRDLTLLEKREFFQIAGPSIETLVGVIPLQDRRHIIDLMSNCLPNIKTFNGNINYLKAHRLNLSRSECSLTDNDILALKALPKLERLLLMENVMLTGRYLNNLTNLRELNLMGCENIQSIHIMEVCKSLKELHTLNIGGCNKFTPEVFVQMQKHCLKLETLRISCFNISYETIARLPALKRLEIRSASAVQQRFFVALSLHMTNQLECLKIYSPNCITNGSAKNIGKLSKLKTLIFGNNEHITDVFLRHFGALQNLEKIDLRGCRKITNTGLLNFVSQCQKLKHVNIKHCVGITDQFVFKAIDCLRERNQENYGNQQYQEDTMEPITFLVYNTRISELMLNDYKYKNNPTILKLSFDRIITCVVGYNIVENSDEEIEEFPEIDDDAHYRAANDQLRLIQQFFGDVALNDGVVDGDDDDDDDSYHSQNNSDGELGNVSDLDDNIEDVVD